MPTNYLNNCDNLEHPVELPSARDEHLPTFFQVESHPLVPDRQKGRIFVYEQDTTKKHMKDFSKWAKARDIPSGTDAQVDRQGKGNVAFGAIFLCVLIVRTRRIQTKSRRYAAGTKYSRIK
jgi:hypothetical protein